MGRLAVKDWWRKTNAAIAERGARLDAKAAALGPQLDARVKEETTDGCGEGPFRGGGQPP